MSEFFSEQLRVFRGAGPPDCPNGAFVYRKIFNIYYDIYLFVSLIFFIYACAYLQFCRHAYAYVFLFCFVIPSSILTIPCYFLSAATCIILPSNYCHYFFPHTRMCASALMQTRTCVNVFFSPYHLFCLHRPMLFFFSRVVAFYTHAYAYLHSCRYAYAYVSLYLSGNSRTRFTPCGPCCLFCLMYLFSSLLFREDMLISRAKSFLVFFSFFCRVAVFPKFLAKVENRKMKDHEQAVKEFCCCLIVYVATRYSFKNQTLRVFVGIQSAHEVWSFGLYLLL